MELTTIRHLRWPAAGETAKAIETGETLETPETPGTPGTPETPETPGTPGTRGKGFDVRAKCCRWLWFSGLRPLYAGGMSLPVGGKPTPSPCQKGRGG